MRSKGFKDYLSRKSLLHELIDDELSCFPAIATMVDLPNRATIVFLVAPMSELPVNSTDKEP